jgi:hypothetical protein
MIKAMRPGHKLTDEQKTFVVQRLACFDSPALVVRALKEEFGATLTAQAVECYDPTKRAGRNLAKRWKTIFEVTRNRFLADTASIGVAHPAVRLARLQRLADRAESAGAIKLAAELLEQAAKETGGMYQRSAGAGSDTGDASGGGVTVNVTIKRFGEPAEGT